MAKIFNCHHIMNDIGSWETKYKSCNYSNDLLEVLSTRNKKVSLNERVNILEIKKAIYYAKKYHGNQKRLTGEPYYSHPLAVASMVADCVFNTDILVTSILHDTIEDTTLTKEMLGDIFGTVIANNVDALTRIKIDCNNTTHKISSAKIIDNLWLQHLKGHNDDLLLIKYCDRLHNLESIFIKPPEKIDKIIEESLKTFISLGIYLMQTKPQMFRMKDATTSPLIKLCYKYLPLKSSLPLEQKIIIEDTFQLPFPSFQNGKHHK